MYLKTENGIWFHELTRTENTQGGKDAELGKTYKSQEEAEFAEGELLHSYRMCKTEIVFQYY